MDSEKSLGHFQDVYTITILKGIMKLNLEN